ADDLVVGRMDLARAPSGGFSDPKQVVGRRASRMIAAQTVVTDRMIENPPLVKRGDSVTIVAQGGGVRATAAGKARQKGCLGDRIAVVNLDSQRTIYAQVVDGRTVAVDF
ncbi:MAG: flagellar basal body P-ring formation protein FlgA, partial [Clostridia bacterium]|nr:flagellar basal body P-ring formation protein FlgA [Clostridia bacterium]